MTLATARSLIGKDAVVQCPRMNLFGILEKVTPDGWLGIRQPGGGYDEAPVGDCEIDPS